MPDMLGTKKQMWWSSCVCLEKPPLCQTLANSDGWGEWKQKMLLPLLENSILSISRKTLITPFGFAQFTGHTWWRVVMRCFQSLCYSSPSGLESCVIWVQFGIWGICQTLKLLSRVWGWSCLPGVVHQLNDSAGACDVMYSRILKIQNTLSN